MPEKPGSEWVAVRPGITLRGVAALPVAALAWVGHMLTFRWLAARKTRGLAEAQVELRRLVSEHEGQDYSFWLGHVGKEKHLEFTTSTGTTYQAEIEAFWDDKPNGAIRVLFALDGGSVSALHPITDSLLVEPEAPASPPAQ